MDIRVTVTSQFAILQSAIIPRFYVFVCLQLREGHSPAVTVPELHHTRVGLLVARTD